jgi:hypothetical protein
VADTWFSRAVDRRGFLGGAALLAGALAAARYTFTQFVEPPTVMRAPGATLALTADLGHGRWAETERVPVEWAAAVGGKTWNLNELEIPLPAGAPEEPDRFLRYWVYDSQGEAVAVGRLTRLEARRRTLYVPEGAAVVFEECLIFGTVARRHTPGVHEGAIRRSLAHA